MRGKDRRAIQIVGAMYVNTFRHKKTWSVLELPVCTEKV